MRKLLILTCVVFLAAVVSLSATETRTLTMGDNNIVLLDENNIFLFPSRINEYPNLAVGEFNADDFRRLGIHWQFGEDNPFVLGTFFENNSAISPDDLFGGPLVGFDQPLLSNRRINLIYGRMLGDYMFGFGLNLIHSSRTNDSPGDQAKESFSFYDFTVSFTPKEGAFDAAANLGLGTFTDQNAAGQDQSKPNGYLEFSLLGRYFLKQNATNVWILHGGIFLAKHGVDRFTEDSPTDLDIDVVEKNSMTAIDLGIGLNYEPAANVLAVADFGLRYSKTKQENDTANGYLAIIDLEAINGTTTVPYFKIGLDAQVFRWMDVRFGATSYWDNDSFERTFAGTVGGTVTQTQSKFRLADNETYLGLGFHWGKLHIDTYTDPELFLDGFNFLSGQSNNMNFRISALYEMK